MEERDGGSISGKNNNTNGKNAYVKAGFSIYNFIDADADTGTDDIGNADDISGMDNITKQMSNNTNTGTNTNADAGNTSGTDNITEEVSNNINIGVAQSGGVGRANKGE